MKIICIKQYNPNNYYITTIHKGEIFNIKNNYIYNKKGIVIGFITPNEFEDYFMYLNEYRNKKLITILK